MSPLQKAFQEIDNFSYLDSDDSEIEVISVDTVKEIIERMELEIIKEYERKQTSY